MDNPRHTDLQIEEEMEAVKRENGEDLTEYEAMLDRLLGETDA